MNRKALFAPIFAIAAAAAVLLTVSVLLGPTARRNAEADLHGMMAHLLPGSTLFTPEEYTGGDPAITAVYRGDTGYVVQTATAGYADDIVMMVAVDHGGTVTGLMVREMAETFGLGRNAMADHTFLMQFLNTVGEAVVGETIDAITGATVTSRAVAKAVSSASAFVTGADVSSGASEWGDW